MQAQDIISAALRELYRIRTGQTASTTEMADGLNALNRLMAEWSTERLLVYAMSRFTSALTPAQQSYTIGTGGAFNTARPIAIRSAVIVTLSGGFVHPLDLVDQVGWNAMPGRSRQASIPLKCWYQSTYPLGTLWLWPTPNAAATIELYSWVQLAQFVALTDTFDLPPGYEKAIVTNLALALASQFATQPSPSLVDTAAKAKAAISGVNAPPIPGVAEEVASLPHPEMPAGPPAQ
jgi:hypothetical protein